jgi:hypothetical protein
MCAALFQLRVMAWRTVQRSGRPSLRIRLSTERHGVPCVRPGAASRVVVLKSSVESSFVS